MNGTGRRGRKPSPEKREAIIRAALDALAARGVEASTTREIAEAAGTTERTLFKHFGSKDGLVQAVIEAVSAQLLADPAFARAHDPRPFTRAEFAAWHRAFLSERVEAAVHAPQAYRIVLGELLRDAAFRERYGGSWLRSVFAPLAEHLRRMQKAGEIGDGSAPAALAGAFFSLNLGYLLTRFALGPGLAWDKDRDIEAIVTMFISACGEPRSGAG